MAIGIASDHAGYELKKILIEHGFCLGITIYDFGCNNTESCDYPDFAHALGKWVDQLSQSRKGILICGTGIGMNITANRHPNVRAALCHSTYDAEYSRKHCDANVICLGARTTTAELAREFVNVFMNTPFEGGRHNNRVEKINKID